MSRAFGFAVVLLAVPAAVLAETQAEKTRSAEEQVAEALQREIYGLESDRTNLLEAATAKVPGLSLIHI